MGRRDRKGRYVDDWDNEELVNYGFPRGMQVLANNPHLLEGFPYVKPLIAYGIVKEDWEAFCFALVTPVRTSSKGIAYEVDRICDIAAQWDDKFFRKRGLCMRLDMPGEEKYGLDFMDLYHQQDGNRRVFNVATGISRCVEKGKMKDEKMNRVARARFLAFESTRVVLDPIGVLDDQKLAYERGWAHWNRACFDAKKAKTEKKASIPVNNTPWNWNTMEALNRKRVDRWPPSKHLYYDRYRGTNIYFTMEHCNYSIFLPDEDSMDKRGNRNAPVMPCDEVPQRILLKAEPEDRIVGKHGEQRQVERPWHDG